MRNQGICVVSGALLVSVVSPALAADPWADAVHEYTPGDGAGVFSNSATALGMPTLMTGVGTMYQSAVTPFSSPYEPEHIVSVGRGGSLVVRFDEPVTNDAANPFGIDLLIFGNSFFADAEWPAGVVAGFFAGGGVVEVSADGSDWRTIDAVQADGLYPTLAYSDLTNPYSPIAGGVQSDFTRPVDPAFEVTIGMSFAQISAGYAGSGGGAGVDIGLAGLSEIRFVRISNPLDGNYVSQIDALADVSPVPAPASLGVIGTLTFVVRRRRRP